MDSLIALYRQRFNLKNAIFLRREHEDALVAIVYKVSQANGTVYILKIFPRERDYLCEIYFLSYFASTLPVPGIIDVVSPEVGVRGAILMESLPGTLLKLTAFTGTVAYENRQFLEGFFKRYG